MFNIPGRITGSSVPEGYKPGRTKGTTHTIIPAGMIYFKYQRNFYANYYVPLGIRVNLSVISYC